MDKITGKNADDIFAHVRDTGEGKSIFLANTNKDREIDAAVKIPGATDIKVLDLVSGDAYSVPVYEKDGGLCVDILFRPAGSVLLIADGNISGCEEAPVYLDSGVAFVDKTNVAAETDKWDVDILEENVLAIDDVTLYLNGSKVLEDQPVSMALHEHFYAAEDGTPFAAEYSFEVSQVPEGEMFAVVESAENLDRITLNGHEVRPTKRKGDADVFDENINWKDVNFVKVPITGYVSAGKNILRLEGAKINNITGPGCHIGVDDFENHAPTEVEAVYIVGDFSVSGFDRQRFVIGRKKEIGCTTDITNSGYPFYAGKASYKTTINCINAEGKLHLMLDNANCACARLIVNGHDAGVKYWYPFVYEVSGYIKEGMNTIEVAASTTLFNLMGPGRISGIMSDTGVGPRTFVAHSRFTNKRALLPFGIGKAYLLKEV